MVCGVGGAGGNAINNMIVSGLSGVGFVVTNTDAQALGSSRAQRIIQMGLQLTEGLGAGSRPEIGKAAAEETLEEICDCLAGSNMVFLAAGIGGGTGTGAAPVIAAATREMGILTIGVVTKPFHNSKLEQQHLFTSAQLIIFSWVEDNTEASTNALKILSKLAPRIPVIVLAYNNDAELARSAICHGAKAYIPVTMGFEIAIAAVRFVLAGGTYAPMDCLLPRDPPGDTLSPPPRTEPRHRP